MERLTGRRRQPRAEMHAALAVQLMEGLAASGISAWLDGGWAVDALLGAQTRPHDDLDLVAPLADADRIQAVLAIRGYVLAGGGAPMSFELVDAEGHQIDVHPVVFTASGDGVYTMGDGERWVYPRQGFAGVGEILGREVPCLTPDVFCSCVTRPATRSMRIMGGTSRCSGGATESPFRHSCGQAAVARTHGPTLWQGSWPTATGRRRPAGAR